MRRARPIFGAAERHLYRLRQLARDQIFVITEGMLTVTAMRKSRSQLSLFVSEGQDDRSDGRVARDGVEQQVGALAGFE